MNICANPRVIGPDHKYHYKVYSGDMRETLKDNIQIRMEEGWKLTKAEYQIVSLFDVNDCSLIYKHIEKFYPMSQDPTKLVIVHITSIREKLEGICNITNVYGIGYKMESA